MIQRIQTVYLFLAALASIVFLFIPFGSMQYAGKVMFLKGNMNLNFEILIGIIVTISLAAIFMYKNRKNQALLVLVNVVLSFVFIGFEIYGMILHAIDNFSVSVGFILPFFVLIFNFLAYKSIKSDDALVKSMDRLR